MHRRYCLQLGLAAVGLGLWPGGNAMAATPPSIRLLVGFPAGGGSDAVARALAEPLSEVLGVPVVVDNRPGAGGQLAAQALKSARPDGATLFLSHDHTISILPQVLKDPGYQPERDFMPVAGLATFVNCLAVSASMPARNWPDALALLRQKGPQHAAVVGVPAPASTPDFLVQALARHYQLDMRSAAYRGGAPLVADMLGGHVQMGIASVQDFIEHHRAGKLRIVAVLGQQRQAVLPDVPTFAELGFAGFAEQPYYGIYAPVGTPAPWVEQVSAAVAKVLARSDLRQRLIAMGLNVQHMPPALLEARQHAYTRAWAHTIAVRGYRPD